MLRELGNDVQGVRHPSLRHGWLLGLVFVVLLPFKLIDAVQLILVVDAAMLLLSREATARRRRVTLTRGQNLESVFPLKNKYKKT